MSQWPEGPSSLGNMQTTLQLSSVPIIISVKVRETSLSWLSVSHVLHIGGIHLKCIVWNNISSISTTRVENIWIFAPKMRWDFYGWFFNSLKYPNDITPVWIFCTTVRGKKKTNFPSIFPGHHFSLDFDKRFVALSCTFSLHTVAYPSMKLILGLLLSFSKVLSISPLFLLTILKLGLMR